MAALTLSLPKLDANPAHPPETRTARVSAWLGEIGRRDPVAAAQLMGDALAATNRVDMSDARRMELAEAYWGAATQLWPRLERTVLQAPHPLTGPPRVADVANEPIRFASQTRIICVTDLSPEQEGGI